MDMEKVIKGIDICLQRFRCGEYCPYYNCEKIGCMEQLREDALVLLKDQEEEIENLKQTAQSMMEGICLLKEQEAAEPINSYGTFRCGNCRNIVGYNDGYGRGYQNNFCSKCGKAVKWE